MTPLEIPNDANVIGSGLVLRRKINFDKTPRRKSRLVGRGYMQVEGVDYGETYAPVAKLHSLRLLLDICATQDLEIDHLDVTTAFLNPLIDRPNVWLRIPAIIRKLDSRFRNVEAVLLWKGLYGLKQAPFLCHSEIHAVLIGLSFAQSTADPNLYLHPNGLIVLLYVDDILIAYRKENTASANWVKKSLGLKFKITDLGPAQLFLGIEIERNRERKEISIRHERFIRTILRRFDLTNSHPVLCPLDTNVRLDQIDCVDKNTDVKEYLSLVGSLMYAAIGTRPDISYAVTSLSKFNSNPLLMHRTAAIRVLRYLKGTAKLTLRYGPHALTSPTVFPHENHPTPVIDHSILHGYSDADHATDRRDRKSISGNVFICSGPISWQAKTQSVVALSTLESEYIAASDATRDALWLSRALKELHNCLKIRPNEHYTVPIGCDNEGALKLIRTGVIRSRTRHIGVKFHHVVDEQKKGSVSFYHISTDQNPADLMTKALHAPRHKELLKFINLC